jgi:demethylmenaquinone methyltransferase/2-methoxy-6-polyprenyl-1,4-benzoquinol methylase
VLSKRHLEYTTWESIIHDIETVEPKYSLLGTIFSLGYAEKIRKEAIKYAVSVGGNGVAVDVGAGPGDSVKTIAALTRDFSYIVAVEPSPVLVTKSCRGFDTVCDAVQAVAEYMPIRSKSAGLVSSFYAVRDFKDVEAGLREMSRIGKVVAIGDIFVPRCIIKRILVKSWICLIVPALAALVYFVRGIRYRGICRSLRGWCSVEELASTLAELGSYSNVLVKKFTLGGLGYVVAWHDTGSGDGRERDKVWGKACRGSRREETSRSATSDTGGGTSS